MEDQTRNNPAHFKTRPSRGVKVMGSLMIILAVLQFQQSFDVGGLRKVYEALYEGAAGVFFYGITVLLLVVEIILGLNILRLKEWARRGVFLLVAVYISITLAMSFTVRKNYVSYIQETFRELKELTLKIKARLGKKGKEYKDAMTRAPAGEHAAITTQYNEEKRDFLFWKFLGEFVLYFNISVLAVKFLLWYVAAPVFFIRPQVKAQFLLILTLFAFPVMPVVLDAWLPVSASWAQGGEGEDIPQQIQNLDEQMRQLHRDYNQQQKNLKKEFKDQLRALGRSPADRVKRKKVMLEANQKLTELEESFKLERDSLREAKSRLLNPESTADRKSAPQIQAEESTPGQMRREYERMKALRDRIRRQDSLFPQEERTPPVPPTPPPKVKPQEPAAKEQNKPQPQQNIPKPSLRGSRRIFQR